MTWLEISEDVRNMNVSFLCLIEPKVNWYNAVSLLIRSVQNNWSTEHKHLFTIMIPVSQTNISSKHVWLDEDMQLCLVHRYPGYPTLNKVRMLPARPSGVQTHVLLDHDIILLDPAKIIEEISLHPSCVQAVCNLNDGAITGFGPDFPKFFYDYTANSFEAAPYVNAGFVIFPESAAQKISTDWPKAVGALEHRWPPSKKRRPYGNASLSLSISKLSSEGVEFRKLDPIFNQRNWGELPRNPVVLHYNDFDTINIEVKQSFLHSMDEFRRFLESTDNRFWRQYRLCFQKVANENSAKLALSLRKAVETLMTSK